MKLTIIFQNHKQTYTNKDSLLQTLRETSFQTTETNSLHFVNKGVSNAYLRIRASMEIVDLLLFALIVHR